ncbi:AI-2E family transporter [Sinimarinibacterium sp. CAU 1509]|uniref:AI-2E family transporter n=1 Tax=Sinimarinibacterium sp. CAU 1509 TaxID=2562283 RepID=UPI0010ACF020|nr:AI-2E family transporter [Sinimarinibacterium sp. CAU 1509]TJY59398.1 AI-2E family transporter [Sinimarinibacterium sp. CAU 1509]
MNLIRNWIERHFSNPQIVGLLLLFVSLWLALALLPTVSQPLLAAVVIAYLLEGPVAAMERRGVRRSLAASTVWLLFYFGVMLALFMLLPQLLRQITQFVQEAPRLIEELQIWLISLSQQYPTFFSDRQIEELLGGGGLHLSTVRDQLLVRTRLLGVGATYLVVYLILVPLIAFFMLKDKRQMLAWLRRFLPADISMIHQVWTEVDGQLANYVRGKAIEIVIVGVVTYATFSLLGLGYAILLGALTGFSVLVPYLGATVVTIPVAAVAYAQFGVSSELAYVVLAYGVIQALDGNVLVPVIFSEANNLHPVAIIIAVLFFGAISGFWGVFFAIPLATVVAAVLRAWPSDAAMNASSPNAESQP